MAKAQKQAVPRRTSALITQHSDMVVEAAAAKRMLNALNRAGCKASVSDKRSDRGMCILCISGEEIPFDMAISLSLSPMIILYVGRFNNTQQHVLHPNKSIPVTQIMASVAYHRNECRREERRVGYAKEGQAIAREFGGQWGTCSYTSAIALDVGFDVYSNPHIRLTLAVNGNPEEIRLMLEAVVASGLISKPPVPPAVAKECEASS